MSGSRRRALEIRRDRQGNRPLGPTPPLEANVTRSRPQLSTRWTVTRGSFAPETAPVPTPPTPPRPF
jgi:hypothetical protein